MHIETFLRFKFIRVIVSRLWERRAEDLFRKIKVFLKNGDKIIDIGAGSCQIANLLIKAGYQATALDIKDFSVFEKLKPTIYDGRKIPFKDKNFDVSLLITTLHHVKDPEFLLKEAARVSKRLVIIEDIYCGNLQKFLTFLMDSLVNLEFFGHPHSNKDDAGWKESFRELDLKLVSTSYEPFWKFFQSGVYYLESR